MLEETFILLQHLFYFGTPAHLLLGMHESFNFETI